MIIQFNSDHHGTATEAFKAPLIASISEKLSRIDEHITRLDVHLKDENGSKGGLNDKRCMLEAHVQGSHLISVTSHANTYEQALSAAIDKLKSSLSTVEGRMKNHV